MMLNQNRNGHSETKKKVDKTIYEVERCLEEMKCFRI